MGAYRKPGVKVESVANARIINLSSDMKIPAYVGIAPTTVDKTDCAVRRASGSGSTSKDYLCNKNIDPSTIRVYTLPNSQGTLIPSSSEGTTFWTYVAASADEDYDHLYWTQTAASGSYTPPSQDEVYYVSYTYGIDSSHYEPQTFTDTSEVTDFYGEESLLNPLAIACNLGLENGAPAVIGIQVSGSGTPAQFEAAIDSLKKVTNIGYVVPIYIGSASSGSVSVVDTYVKNHCIEMSVPTTGKERSCILGRSALSSTSTDAEQVNDHTNYSSTISHKRVTLAAPANGVSRAGSGLTLNGRFCAAAIAGSRCGQEKVIYPIHGKTILGLTITDDQYDDYYMDRFGANNVSLLVSHMGVVTARDDITTDGTSADTQEPAIVATDDWIRRETREALYDRFIKSQGNKSVVITPDTPSDIESAVASIWSTYVKDGYIYAYGTKNDPSTGEKKISATQDSTEPRKIRVTGSIKYLYGLKWIDVTFYTYV